MCEELAEQIRIAEKNIISAFAQMAPIVKDMVERINNNFNTQRVADVCHIAAQGEVMQDLGLQLWKEWFEWSGNPWESDDYGRINCFFCSEESPNHSSDCIFVKAQSLIATQQNVFDGPAPPETGVYHLEWIDADHIRLTRLSDH